MKRAPVLTTTTPADIAAGRIVYKLECGHVVIGKWRVTVPVTLECRECDGE